MPSAGRAWPPSGLAWATTENRLCRRPNQRLGTGKPTQRRPGHTFHRPARIRLDAGPHDEAADSKWAHSAGPSAIWWRGPPTGRVPPSSLPGLAERVAQIPPNAQDDDHVPQPQDREIHYEARDFPSSTCASDSAYTKTAALARGI